MLRYLDRIRLTLRERQTFSVLTGCHSIPTTVVEYNQQLEESAAEYSSADTLEERHLGELAKGLLVKT